MSSPVAAQKPITDPRKNLPSASGLQRLKDCPGSRALESQLTQIKENEVAITGTKIHEALATANPFDLDEQERWVYERCLTLEAEVVRTICNNDDDIIRGLEVFGEERHFLKDADGKEISSGQYDKLYLHRERDFIIVDDYKSGYKATIEPSKNLQAREYAVLVSEAYNIGTVYVAIIQPNCYPASAVCVYEREDIVRAKEEILGIIKLSEDPNAKRIPGDVQCEHCKAKAVCPEQQVYLIDNLPSILEAGEKEILVSIEELDLREKLLPGDRLAKLLDMSATIEDVRKSLKEEAKLRMKMGRPVPGYSLIPGIKKRFINDNYGLYLKLQKWLSPVQIFDMMKFTLGEIEKTLKQATGRKGEDLKKFTADTIQHHVGYTDPDMMVKRIKE